MVLAWAGLLLLVLYSPLGSPEMYNHSNYSLNNVRVETIESNENSLTSPVRNAKSSKRSASINQESSTPEFDIESAVSTQSVAKSSYNTFESNSLSGINSNSIRNSSKDNRVSGSYVDGSFVSKNGNSSKNTSNSPGTNVLFSSSSLLPNNNNNVTNRQAANGGLSDNTDPGGDPNGPPIPVGDGWILLMILVSCYTLFKVKPFKR